MKTIIERRTPETLTKPVGNYSHITKIPANVDWYTFSGQIGINDDGVLSENFNEQVFQTFDNIKRMLDCEKISVNNVVKVNIWSVDEIDWDYFDEVWEEVFGSLYPSMTIAYVSALGLEEIKIEIEIWAVKETA